MKENEIYRKCISCNTIQTRDKLIKITKQKNENEVKIMPDLSISGRSVYICKNKECVNLAFKKDKIFKILKIQPTKELKEKISTVLEN